MNKRLLIAAALMLPLTGCETLAEMEFPGRSVRNRHDIKVTVYNNAIEVNVRELFVRGQDNVIFWTIDNAGGQDYSFPDNGIAFKTDPGRREFTCMRLNPRKFKCHDKGGIKGKFEYGVTLNGSPPVRPLDPYVVND